MGAYKNITVIIEVVEVHTGRTLKALVEENNKHRRELPLEDIQKDVLRRLRHAV